MKLSRAAVASATVAHVLAWVAFLLLALWPYAYQGVSTTPVQVDEVGNPVGTAQSEVVQYSASFVEVNGFGALASMLVPIALTGLALIILLSWRARGMGNTFVIWVITVLLLAFCLLASLSFGALFVPSALALTVAAVVFSFRPGLPRVPQE
ncbi:MAG: hypothetical protein F4X65_06690 [Chloroflexi bacterium]|nr:hypothetical protein [Chloroflexota bacterium]